MNAYTRPLANGSVATARIAATPATVRVTTVTTFAALLAVLASACASGPSGPPPFNPVGSFSFTAHMDGQPISGTVTITAAEDGYEGTINSDIAPPISITSVTVEGQTGTVEAAGPMGPLVINFVEAAGAITGSWSMGGQGGPFTMVRTS